jgi:hypothetical protein
VFTSPAMVTCRNSQVEDNLGLIALVSTAPYAYWYPSHHARMQEQQCLSSVSQQVARQEQRGCALAYPDIVPPGWAQHLLQGPDDAPPCHGGGLACTCTQAWPFGTHSMVFKPLDTSR